MRSTKNASEVFCDRSAYILDQERALSELGCRLMDLSDQLDNIDAHVDVIGEWLSRPWWQRSRNKLKVCFGIRDEGSR